MIYHVRTEMRQSLSWFPVLYKAFVSDLYPLSFQKWYICTSYNLYIFRWSSLESLRKIKQTLHIFLLYCWRKMYKLRKRCICTFFAVYTFFVVSMQGNPKRPRTTDTKLLNNYIAFTNQHVNFHFIAYICILLYFCLHWTKNLTKSYQKVL